VTGTKIPVSVPERFKISVWPRFSFHCEPKFNIFNFNLWLNFFGFLNFFSNFISKFYSLKFLIKRNLKGITEKIVDQALKNLFVCFLLLISVPVLVPVCFMSVFGSDFCSKFYIPVSVQFRFRQIFWFRCHMPSCHRNNCKQSRKYRLLKYFDKIHVDSAWA